MFGSPWAVILAGGDGQRVSELTRGDDGRSTPKQYCRLGGGQAMVRWALDRARRVIPPERIAVVVNEAHRNFWEADLSDVPRHNILVQPRNRGTAAGVLLPLLTLQFRAGDEAPMLFLPSDHFVADESVLRDAIVTALGAVTHGASVVLLGMEAGAGDGDYGWVVPDSGARISAVRRFVEKPPEQRARQLMLGGGLVNTFVFAVRRQDLVDLFAGALPQFTRLFRAHLRYPVGVVGLHELYDSIETADLSREVFQRVSPYLSVVRVPPCGWSDLGTPARLQAFLDFADRQRAAAGQTAGRAFVAA